MKNLRIVQIAAWSVVAVLLTGVLVLGIARGGYGGLYRFGFDWNFTSAEKQVLTQSAASSGVDTVDVGVASADVVFRTGGSDIQVACYGPDGKDDNEYSVSRSGSELLVKQKMRLFSFHWFDWGSRRVEITLPENWHGSLAVSSASGGVQLPGGMQLSNINIALASGDVACASDAPITAEDVKISSVSGDLNLGSLSCKTFSLSSTSGDVRAASLAGQGRIHTVSGDVGVDSLARMDGAVSAGSVSGDIRIGLGQGVGAQVTAGSVSGDISATGSLSFSGSHSASGQIGTGPYQPLSLSTTSGDIRIG